ncbi:ThiF family adenylyltransferase [Gallibacterium sp. AGMB14963]|uniref:ThiF family adenylyltransferase n=1 Tax=Gallibacterium faecale TaxID=3019086 RepID=UPI0022F171C8|nr:ThiF family adenylyltransferase [Gallibacterium sp. AGMB14963]MDA3979746.1 ThiF family adenylyltransferase [Gallibacterium sp. AGMB14963]
MGKNYKLKTDALLHYDEFSTKILLGTKCVEIFDDDQTYFSLLKKREWALSDLPNDLVEVLIEHNLIIKSYTHYYKNSELDRNIYLIESLMDSRDPRSPIDIQNTISNSRILLLGVGGIGCIVLDNLLRLGIKDFFIVDSDIVDKSNLNRQILFTKDDVGSYKVDVIKDKLKLIYSSLNIEKSRDYIDDHSLLKSICINYCPDFIINALDTPQNIERIILDVSTILEIPSINCGVGINSGFWGPISIYPFVESNKKYDKSPNLISKPIKGSLPTTNMMIGSMMCQDILQYFINPRTENLYYRKIFNFQTFECEVI